jgi:two-component system CheB/CheR fusion protein
MTKKTTVKKKASKPSISKEPKEELIAEEKSRHRSKPFPIVAIGASAGGLEAISELLKNLSPSTGMAYVYIQHLNPTHESMLSNILSRTTRMKVVEAEERMRIEANHLFIIPPNKDMHIIDGVLTLDPRPPKPELHMPINRFFISLADKQKEGAIGIVLSGNANDGAQGLKAIKIAGGLTFAQDSTAKFQSMPRNAVAEGSVDLILSPKEIAKELERLSAQSTVLQKVMADGEDFIQELDSDNSFKDIINLLKKSTGVNFTHYKKTTISRRIVRRMLLHKLETLKEYAQYLRQHTNEITALYQDLLINVTSFFRDAEVMDYMKQTLLPKLLKSKTGSDPIRIWIPGCSTGEEAYSFAMILLEVLGDSASNTAIQIFATDLSETAIAKARLGLYSKADVAEVSPERLQKFFSVLNSSYRISKTIRDLCVFATHNIFKDPPFTRLDIISCRNLLIYLDTVLQEKVIATFHYALQNSGYLVLGKSETIGSAENLFGRMEKTQRIYQRKGNRPSNGMAETRYRLPENAGERYYPVNLLLKDISKQLPKKEVPDIEKTVDNLLLSRYVPACVVINSDYEILQFRGSTGLFLDPSPGRASLNLLKMAKESLGFELRTAIHKVQKTNEAFRKSGIAIKHNGGSKLVTIEVAPMKTNSEEQHFLVVFREMDTMMDVSKGSATSKDKHVKQLEQELERVREDMRSIVEEQEAANEELQSANEEIVSSNEELQSLNEELETSKEEVESTNEELMTINQELQMRNEQLSEAYDYSESVFGTIRESVIVLDSHLRVKTANKAFYETFKRDEEDTEGRLIYDLGNRQWNIPRLLELLEDIIPKNNKFFGFEVVHEFPDIGKKTMMLNARKINQKVHGQELILLAIEDITEHVEGQRIIKEREELFRNMANNAPVMIWTSDAEGNRTFFNKTWLDFTGKKLEDEVGMQWLKDVNPVDREEFMKIYKDALEKRMPYSAEYRLLRKDNTFRWMLSAAKPFYDVQNNFTGFIGTVTEIHDQRMINAELEERVKRRTAALEEAKSNLEKSNIELKQFSYVASHDLQEPLRKIQTFSGRILDKENQNLSESGKDQFKRIQTAATNMQKLIDDLLSYSRSNTEERKFEKIHLEKIVKEVKEDLREVIKSKHATVEAGEMCEALVIPFQFRQMMLNLVSNALKFSDPARDPQIRIKSEIVKGDKLNNAGVHPDKYCHITVSDNGIGFEQQYSEKIFELFQRLYGKSEYEGTGIGLAIVKKIVENHNGIITATGELNKGATFDIFIPAD